MSLKLIATALIAATAVLPAHAATTIASAYTRISGAENITAPFTAPNGVSSLSMYTGPIEVLVSGTGASLGATINDAFYFTATQQGLGGNYYHLGMGTSASPLTPFNPALGVERFINFIDNVGAVPFGSIPTYAANNSYHFVADIGALSSLISFGVLDGNYADNSGSYRITVWQLAPAGAVPEAATWGMMIVGFGAVGAAVRRRKVAVKVFA